MRIVVCRVGDEIGANACASVAGLNQDRQVFDEPVAKHVLAYRSAGESEIFIERNKIQGRAVNIALMRGKAKILATGAGPISLMTHCFAHAASGLPNHIGG